MNRSKRAARKLERAKERRKRARVSTAASSPAYVRALEAGPGRLSEHVVHAPDAALLRLPACPDCGCEEREVSCEKYIDAVDGGAAKHDDFVRMCDELEAEHHHLWCPRCKHMSSLSGPLDDDVAELGTPDFHELG